jgi:phosphoglycerate dehydrogenase-like enzyme
MKSIRSKHLRNKTWISRQVCLQASTQQNETERSVPSDLRKRLTDSHLDILQTVTILLTMSVLPEPKDAPKLRYIHFSVTGTNHVAHRTVFKQPGITITTSTGAPAPAVAEWVIGSILTHSRSFPRFQQFQKESTWGRLALPAPGDLVGKKMAILGYGSIGRQGTSSRSCSSHFEDEMLTVLSYANFDDLADAQQSGALRRRWGWR